MTKPSAQSGAALLYILMAVALLAALTVILTRGSRTGTQGLTDQQARIAAQEIIDYGSNVATAAQKLRLRGCLDTQISFTNTVFFAHGGAVLYNTNHNGNAPTSGECDLFKPAGGNISAQLFPDTYTQDWPGITTGNTGRGSPRNFRAQLPGIGADGKEELLLIIPYVRQEVCLKINDILGVPNPDGTAPVVVSSTSNYHGSYTDDGTYRLTNAQNVISGRAAFCAVHSTLNPEDNFFVQVLLAR